MGNRAVITIEDEKGHTHPVALYVHWNGGLESVLAFLTYTWQSFERGRDDLFVFHARLCQVIGNFFPDGLSLYAEGLEFADSMAVGCDNGRFHFTVGKHGVELKGREDEVAETRKHIYWTCGEDNIFDTIRRAMPTLDREDYASRGGVWNADGEGRRYAPGPWTFLPGQDGWPVVGHDGSRICDLQCVSTDDLDDSGESEVRAQALGNGCLISTAPDLLAVLRRCVNLLRTVGLTTNVTSRLADDCGKAVKVGTALMQSVTGTETAR